MKSVQIGALSVMLLITLSGVAGSAQTLPRQSLQLQGQALSVEVAATPDSRRQGLMGRTELAANSGMLFVFTDDDIRCLWMKNTPLPLSAAFIDAEGYLINHVDLQPHDEQIRCSLRPARYALEVAQGWFVRHGIQPGSRVQGLPVLEPGN